MNTHAAWCFDEDNNEMECEILPCAGEESVASQITHGQCLCNYPT